MENSRARKRLQEALTPAAITSAKPMTPAATWADLMAEVVAPEVHCSGLQHKPEELPAAVRKFLSHKRGRGRFPAKKQPCRDGGRASKQDKPCSRSATGAITTQKENKRDNGGLALNRDTCSSMRDAHPKQPSSGSKPFVATGVFSKRPPKRPRRSGKKDDASFFFQLQTGVQNSQEESVPDDASSSSGDSFLGRHGSLHNCPTQLCREKHTCINHTYLDHIAQWLN